MKSARPARHVFLDIKSLPRSGLHALKGLLSHVFEDQFSFCEWYQEPGCCRRQPCALNPCFARATPEGRLSLRAVKSHDFQLTDVRPPATPDRRRLILTRDPLYVLTSLFALEVLMGCGNELKAFGIGMRKILYLHEPAVVAEALRILDTSLTVRLDETSLVTWLAGKVDYISRFRAKWQVPCTGDEGSGEAVISYDEIPGYVASLVDAMAGSVSDDVARNYRARAADAARHFRTSRQDPFRLPSEKLTEFTLTNRKLFIEAAQQIMSGRTSTRTSS